MKRQIKPIVSIEELPEIDFDMSFEEAIASKEDAGYELSDVKKNFVTSTPDAEQYLTLNTYKRQRPTNIARVKDLYRKMKDNKFLGMSIAIAIQTHNRNKQVLMNGQHQLVSYILYTRKNPDNPRIYNATVEYYNCSTDKQVALLFAQFDDNKRTDKQIAAAYADLLGNHWNKFNEMALTHISSALLIVQSGYKSPKDKIDREYRFSLLKNKTYKKHAIWAANLLYGGESAPKWLRRPPCIASMIGCHMAHEDSANNLFLAVRDNTAKRGTPAYALREWLADDNRRKVAGQIYTQFKNVWDDHVNGRKRYRIKWQQPLKNISFGF